VSKKDGENVFSKACSDWSRRNGFKLREGRSRLGIGKKFFCHEDGETLERVSQKGNGGAIPRNTEGQVG